MTSQNQQILRHLKTGKTLTPMYALKAFGSMRTAARVKELRDDGWRIHTRMATTPTGKRIAVYWMGAK